MAVRSQVAVTSTFPKDPLTLSATSPMRVEATASADIDSSHSIWWASMKATYDLRSPGRTATPGARGALDGAVGWGSADAAATGSASSAGVPHVLQIRASASMTSPQVMQYEMPGVAAAAATPASSATSASGLAVAT